MSVDLEWWFQQATVRVGELWIPGRQAESTLARYTKQLFCLTHHADYPYCFLGSATGISYDGKYFMAWCRHQTRDYAPDDVTIPVEGGKTIISGEQYLFVTPTEVNRDEDYTDLCAMQFVPERYGVGNLAADFFSIRTDELWRGDDAPLFVFGYPTALRRVDYEEPHVHVTQVVTSARYLGPSNATYLHRVALQRTQTFPLDGLSGGPVYHLSKNKKGFFIGLAGISVRGGGELLYFLDARFLVEMLRKQSSG